MRNVVGAVLFLGAIYALVVYCFGVTKVTAKDGNGKSITAEVYIDGEFRGETPLDVHLLAGDFKIEVRPPIGYRALHAHFELLTFGMGKDFEETMEPLAYSVSLSCPSGEGEPVYKVVDNATGKMVAKGEGESCELELPGPGDYRAFLEVGDCAARQCTTGHKAFTIADKQPTMEVRWN